MHTTRTRIAILAILFSGWAASNAVAGPITQPLYYETVGGVGGPGDPNGPITFTGVSLSQIVSPGTFNLGTFTVPSLPATASLTYNSTPFTVDAYISTTPGVYPWNGPTVELQFNGTLTGTVTGNSQTSLLASVSSIEQLGPGTLPFSLSELTVSPQLLLPGGATTTLVATLNPGGTIQPVPEPTSLALFLTVLGGLGVRRWRRTVG